MLAIPSPVPRYDLRKDLLHDFPRVCREFEQLVTFWLFLAFFENSHCIWGFSPPISRTFQT